MNGCIHLTDGAQTDLDDVSSDQVRTMQELMGEDNVFTVDATPRGSLFSVNGCIGQIDFKEGGTICIAPEVSVTGGEVPPQKLLIEMMYSIFGITANRDMCENLFEFFVKLFIDSVQRLIVRGLRSKYHLVQGNEKAFKGRIMFAENIRENYIHKERIYVEYEIYSQNRAENRLIVRTLEAIVRHTQDAQNIKNAKTLLLSLEDIPASMDVGRDFSMCVIDRNTMDYVTPLMWCDIFLNGMGMGNGSKGELSYAVLLSSRDVFAAYVGRESSNGRTDGSYSLKYTADIKNDGAIGGTSVIRVNLDWCYYDRIKGIRYDDAEILFKNAPGYRVIPGIEEGDRLKLMAGSYLSDMLVE